MRALPFILFIISLVVVPKRYERIVCIILGSLGILVAPSLSHATHMLWYEYIPFITLITNLYIIASCLKISLSFKASSFNLTIFLGLGAVLANILGTTGASIFWIHPLFSLLKQRQHKTHVIMFFILLVSNCGGCLTPLGDPPLFMGYLKGVPFFWPLLNLWGPYLFIIGALLLLFYSIDRFYYKENLSPIEHQFNIQGFEYFALLAVVIIASFFQNTVIQISILCGLFYWHYQRVNWAPVYEVAQVFLVIFITMIPIEPSLFIPSNLTPLKTFWLCGGLSAFLDNAPTYLLFFPLAKHNSLILKAISLSSVCMGALTYIGNAPNLMIKTLAENEKIPMPSFIKYSIYTTIILGPILWTVSWIMFS